MVLNFIEVCAGAGGLSSGLIKAGLQPLLLIDNDKDCVSTLKINHGSNTKIECCSFNTYDMSDYVGKVDILTGGVPCQSFSQAGKRKGLNDPRGNLMNDFIDLVHLIKPKLFMIENVKGLLSHNKGQTFNTIINKFIEKSNYNIVYKCINANDYGVPQKRERVFIIGTLKSLQISYQFPKVIDKKPVLHDILKNVPESIGAQYSDLKIQLYNYIPQGGCWINLPENIQKEYLGNSYNSSGGKRGILKRLSMNEPSLTLLCSPSQKQTERCHPIYNRPLNIREYARIQTFDDDYTFSGSMNSQYKQIGNAVPVHLAKLFGLSFIQALS